MDCIRPINAPKHRRAQLPNRAAAPRSCAAITLDTRAAQTRPPAALPASRCVPPPNAPTTPQLTEAHDEVVAAILKPIKQAWREMKEDSVIESLLAFVHAIDWKVGGAAAAGAGGSGRAALAARPWGQQSRG